MQLEYSSPLRLSTKELRERIHGIFSERINNDSERGKLKRWFTYIKNDTPNEPYNFANHCNGEAHFAVTSLYLTAGYFARTIKIREELPFSEFPKYSESLVKYIEAIRESWRGEYAIWEESQDSIGKDVTNPNGFIITFREFCTAVMDSQRHPWFLRLIDYYRDFDLKPKEEIENIKSKLDSLIDFLQSIRIAPQTLRMTDER